MAKYNRPASMDRFRKQKTAEERLLDDLRDQVRYLLNTELTASDRR